MNNTRDDLILNWTWTVSRTIQHIVPHLTEPQSEQIADQIVRDLLATVGGQSVYVPLRPRTDADQIRAAYNGRNITELAMRHKLSKRRIYQILK